jgi:hypothetical protein
MKLLLGMLLIQAVGVLSVQCIFPGKDQTRMLESMGLGFGLGIGLISMGMFYLAYWQVPLTTPNVVGLVLALLLILAVLRYVRTNRTPAQEIQILGKPSWRVNRLELSLGGIISLLGLVLLLDTLSKPLQSFDACAIWGMKAQVLFDQQGIYGEDFFDAERLHAHQRYPLLIPLSECFLYHFFVGFEDRYVKILFPALFVSLNLTFYAVLRRFFGRGYSLVGAGLLMSLPAFIIFENGGAGSGYADVPLAYFAFGFAASLFLWLCEGESGRLTIATLFGVFLIFTKQEGLALWALTMFCVISLRLAGDRKSTFELKPLLVVCLVTIVLLYPWFHYRSQLPLNDEDYFGRLGTGSLTAGTARLPFILWSFFKEILLKPHLWNLLGLLFIFTLVASPLKTFWLRHSLLFWIPAAYCILIGLIFMVSPWKAEELVPLTLTRLLIQVAPMIVLWLFFQIEAVELLPKAWTLRRN